MVRFVSLITDNVLQFHQIKQSSERNSNSSSQNAQSSNTTMFPAVGGEIDAAAQVQFSKSYTEDDAVCILLLFII